MKFTRKTLYLAIVFLLCVVFLTACNNKKEDTVEVLPAKTIEISTAEELFGAQEYVGPAYANYTLVLKNDIDLSTYVDSEGKIVSWEPIGKTESKAFCGVFDGNGKTIKGLTLSGWYLPGESEDYAAGYPKYIAKRIIGWKKDGTPVYKSSEIVSATFETVEVDGELQRKVVGYVCEGDNADPDYVDMMDNGGYLETTTAFGSVGLFGYTKNATVKNLMLDSASLYFYGTGDKVFAGFVSGYDIGSCFTGVTVKNSELKVSTIYENYIAYNTTYATPESIGQRTNTTQYLGGIVGYSQADSSVINNEYIVDYPVFNDIHTENIIVNNYNYASYFNAGWQMSKQQKNEAYVWSNLEEGLGEYSVVNAYRSAFSEAYSFAMPNEAFIGGIAGLVKGNDFDKYPIMKNVSVDGLDQGCYVIGHKITAGGICGYLSGALIQDTTASNIKLIAQKNGEDALIYRSAIMGGAFAQVKSSTIETSSVSSLRIEGGAMSMAQNICLGGFAGYCDSKSSLSGIDVNDAYLFSSYTSMGELGSIIGGVIGVLRDSSATDLDSQNITFDISSHKESDYIYTSCLVSQVYGNSTYSNSDTSDCYYTVGTVEDFTEKRAYVVNNNYVNENGENSIRLYYHNEKGEYSGVYVTVYGEIVKVRTDANDKFMYYLHDDYVWEGVSSSEVANSCDEGGFIVISSEKPYYLYDNETGVWNQIRKESIDEYRMYNENSLYAVRKSIFRVEFTENMAGKTVGTDGFMTYDIEKGELKKVSATDTFKEGETYYLPADETLVGELELRVTVYSESGDVLVIKKGKTEDDDILAEEIKFAISVKADKGLSDVEIAQKTYGSLYDELCPAELYLTKYFSNGFVAGKDGTIIVDGNGKRDFSKYAIVTGRPSVEDSLKK